MKGEIGRVTDFRLGIRKYIITYEHGIEPLIILEEDMGEFMDDIMSAWMKLNGIDVWRFENKTEIIERRAREAVETRKDFLRSEKEQAYEKGYNQALLDVRNIASSKKVVITPEEEAEQDRDRREMKLKELDDLTKTHKAGYLTGYEVGYEDSQKNRPNRFKKNANELEMDSETKTYNNPFPTDEALDFDVNIREKV